MVQKGNGKGATAVAEKPRAVRLPITQLIVLTAYAKTFSTGKAGWFGKVTDPTTGDQYQVIGAVRLNRTGTRSPRPPD